MAGSAGPNAADQRWGLVGVGCIGIVAGFFGGGMIAALVAKIVGSMQGCKPQEGLPACNHMVYVGVGAVLGAILLPTVSIVLMRRSRRRS